MQKVKGELKSLQHSFHTIALGEGTIFTKKCRFLPDFYLLFAVFYHPPPLLPSPQNEPLQSPPRLGIITWNFCIFPTQLLPSGLQLQERNKNFVQTIAEAFCFAFLFLVTLRVQVSKENCLSIYKNQITT